MSYLINVRDTHWYMLQVKQETDAEGNGELQVDLESHHLSEVEDFGAKIEREDEKEVNQEQKDGPPSCAVSPTDESSPVQLEVTSPQASPCIQGGTLFCLLRTFGDFNHPSSIPSYYHHLKASALSRISSIKLIAFI